MKKCLKNKKIKMRFFILIILLRGIPLFAQNANFEQIAIDYYSQIIHNNECIKKEKYILSDSIHLRKSSFLHGVCFEDYKKVQKNGINEIVLTESNEPLKSNIFPLLTYGKHTKKSIITVHRASISPKKTIFVEISITNQRKGKYYYIELTFEKEPIRWCKKEVIF